MCQDLSITFLALGVTLLLLGVAYYCFSTTISACLARVAKRFNLIILSQGLLVLCLAVFFQFKSAPDEIELPWAGKVFAIVQGEWLGFPGPLLLTFLGLLLIVLAHEWAQVKRDP